MDKLYENVKKDITKFVNDLSTQKLIGYAHSFGKVIGLHREQGKIIISPQYVIATHVLYPYYTGRTLLLASTAVVMFLPENE